VTNVVLGNSGGSGKSGYSGYSGVAGSIGSNGYSGYSGLNGVNGNSGYSGYSGYIGQSGYSGINGLNGLQLTVDSGGNSFSISPGNYEINGQVYYFSGLISYDVSYFVTHTPTSIWFIKVDNSGAPLPSYSNGWSADANAPTSSQLCIGKLAFPTNGSAIGGVLTAIDYRAAYQKSVSGWSGYSGVAGVAGSNGLSGYSGQQGIQGISGFSGAAGGGGGGNSGYSGYSGKSGYSGFSGTNGLSGTSGFSGVKGDPGTGGGASSVGGWGQICISDGAGGWTTPGLNFNYSNSPDNKLTIGDGTNYDYLEVNCYSVQFTNGFQTTGLFCTGNIGTNNMPTSDPYDGVTWWCDEDNGNVIKRAS
jgi:hypothetical protein